MAGLSRFRVPRKVHRSRVRSWNRCWHWRARERRNCLRYSARHWRNKNEVAKERRSTLLQFIVVVHDHRRVATKLLLFIDHAVFDGVAQTTGYDLIINAPAIFSAVAIRPPGVFVGIAVNFAEGI